MDKETKKTLSEGESLKILTSAPQWRIAKKKLFQMCHQLDKITSIVDLDKMSDEDLAKEVRQRYNTVTIQLDWLGVIETGKDQFDQYTKSAEESEMEGLIKDYD